VRITLDSNILVYAADHQAGERHRAAADLLHRAARADCVLTLQSLGEFFHVATRKMKRAAEDVALFVDAWRAAFAVHAASEQSLDSAVDLVKRHGLSFWDAMLWATAGDAGCRLLLSEDLHDGLALRGVTCVNPFAAQNTRLIVAALPPIG
jgi:predicted nucleic acid-binding protein